MSLYNLFNVMTNAFNFRLNLLLLGYGRISYDSFQMASARCNHFEIWRVAQPKNRFDTRSCNEFLLDSEVREGKRPISMTMVFRTTEGGGHSLV